MSAAHRFVFLIAPCCLLSVTVKAQNQPAPVPQKLSLTAALVLTPEFCSTINKKGSEKFKVGKAACGELGPALQGVFSSLSLVDDSSKTGNAQVVLEPRFADVGATQKAFAFSNRELVLLVEWTARDQSGRVIWLDTVQGSAKRHIGNAFTYGSNLKHIVEDSAKDLAEQSAIKMSSAPPLQKLGAQQVK